MGGILPACEFFTPERGATLGILCIVLVVLLVGAIWLGFGPLRARLGFAAPDRSAGHQAMPTADGLLGCWRLLRELRHTEPPSEDFSRRDLPLRLVRLSTVGSAARRDSVRIWALGEPRSSGWPKIISVLEEVSHDGDSLRVTRHGERRISEGRTHRWRTSYPL